MPYTALTPTARYQADCTWEKIVNRFTENLANEPDLQSRAPQILSVLRRSLLETVPVAWDTYEPNLREFIGMTFAMLLEYFETLLPEAIVARIRESVYCLD